MKIAPPLAAVVALMLSGVAGGVAQADNSADTGSSRNDARRQVDRPAPSGATGRPDKKNSGGPAWDAPKMGQTIRDEAANLALDDKALADMREALEDTSVFAVAPGARQAVFGGSVPLVGMGGLVPNARALAAYISNTYPGVQAIGGVRSDPLPDHPSGHAIDIMIGWDMGLGDAISADVQRQAGRFGVVYSLWRVANHYDHVHVTVS